MRGLLTLMLAAQCQPISSSPNLTSDIAYHVELSNRAQRDIEAAYEHIAADAPQTAIDFRHGLQGKINFLKVFPQRCGVAPEDKYRDETIRQTVHKSYRILFVIRDDSVHVIHVRHGARREMTAKETKDLEP